MTNLEVRMRAKSKNIALWRVADAIGVSESSFYRMLRTELPNERKKHLMDIIDQLAKKKHR